MVKGAVKYKNIVYLLLSVLLIVGVYGLFNMNKDEFPTFEINQGLVAAVYPGADVDQVEQEVAKPLEDFLFTMPEVNRSATKVVSKNSICYIYVDLNTPSAKKTEIWSKIRLKLDEFKMNLPSGVLAIVVMDDFSELTSILVALESEDKGYTEMRGYARDLSDRLHKIPTLGGVKIIGEQSEEIAVHADMDKFSDYGISPASLMLDYGTSGLQVLGGTFNTSYANSPVQIARTVSDEQELGGKIIWSGTDGQVLRLCDVAQIERRRKDPTELIKLNGNNAVILSIAMRPDNNIIAFGKEVDKVLGEFEAEIPESVTVSRITDQPEIVGDSIWSFVRDLIISMLVVIAVMLLLFPMRSALIASSGVPACTIIALALMYVSGMGLNTVSLAALIVCLGMIVDDSIITMDGYMDKLNRGMGRTDAACASAQELFPPMLMATSAISLMFFPACAMIHGYLGDFVSIFPWVIAFALMASLVYALVVVPPMEVKFISSGNNNKQNFLTKAQDKLFNDLQKSYEWLQMHCFRHPKLTLLAGVGAIALGLLMFSQTNMQLMPKANRELFTVEIYLDPSADLEQTAAVADSLTALLRADERITGVTAFIGSSAPRFHATYSPLLPGPNMAQLIVNTKSNKATQSCLSDLESEYENYFPNALVHFKQMDYQGVNTPVEIRVFGDDYDAVKEVSDSVRNYMSTLDMLKWVHSEADYSTSNIKLNLNREEALRLGVNRTLMNLSLTSALNGIQISSIREGDNMIPVILYSDSFDRDADYEDLMNTLVPTAIPGISVPVRQVADASPEWKPENRTRINGESVITVNADMKYGCSQPVAMREIEKFVDSYELPEGVRIDYGGLNSMNDAIGPEIIAAFLCAVAVLFFFLLFHFKKISLAILTILLSTLCLFGAFFGLWIFKLDFSLTAVLGLISLVGIIVRNGILMFEYAEELRFTKGYSVRDAAEESGKRRMRPIFLTSCTTALGVLPMIISGDLLWMPMGVVICFGTMLSVYLITLIMPIAYWQIFRKAK